MDNIINRTSSSDGLSAVARSKPWTDIAFTFRSNPITGDVYLKKDIEAIRQSVMNIILTKRGERPFDSSFGSNLSSFLFDNFDPITFTLIKQEIESSIINYEPRVRILNIDLVDQSDRNALSVSIEVLIISPTELTTTIDFIVERLR